ncbi:MAG: DUF1934 domain-containing protein [Acutalibacteraceae bacterium]|nr:DUF1934 domain-containing protein [Acutalibacteraceae bacterium]
MKNSYLITVVTVQEIEGEKEVLELTTHADFSGNSDDYTITYREHDSEEGESKTVLRVENSEKVSVSREGAINSYMTIETGVRHLSHHVTPYGAFSLGITAKKVNSDMDENGGSLIFRYTTDQEMQPIGEIEFTITLKRKDFINVSDCK